MSQTEKADVAWTSRSRCRARSEYPLAVISNTLQMLARQMPEATRAIHH